MPDWKLPITVIIVIVVLFGIISVLYPAKNIFESIGFSMPVSGSTKRGVSFLIELDDYQSIFQNVINVDIKLNATNATVDINDGKLISDYIEIRSFSGSINITKGHVKLKGSGKQITAPQITLENVKSIKTDAQFSYLLASNMSVEIISINASGYIKTQGAVTSIENKSISIKSPEGIFEFSGRIKAEGKAFSISIPETSIEVKSVL